MLIFEVSKFSFSLNTHNLLRLVYMCCTCTCTPIHICMPTDPQASINKGVSIFSHCLVSKVPPFCWPSEIKSICHNANGKSFTDLLLSFSEKMKPPNKSLSEKHCLANTLHYTISPVLSWFRYNWVSMSKYYSNEPQNESSIYSLNIYTWKHKCLIILSIIIF